MVVAVRWVLVLVIYRAKGEKLMRAYRLRAA
jgi:hypothetical protein